MMRLSRQLAATTGQWISSEQSFAIPLRSGRLLAPGDPLRLALILMNGGGGTGLNSVLYLSTVAIPSVIAQAALGDVMPVSTGLLYRRWGMLAQSPLFIYNNGRVTETVVLWQLRAQQ